MSGRPGGGKNKILFPPVNFTFDCLLKKKRVLIWLVEQTHIKVEGTLRGFDEFMNMVLTDAVEVREKTKTTEEVRRNIGEILLKGDNICLIQCVDVE